MIYYKKWNNSNYKFRLKRYDIYILMNKETFTTTNNMASADEWDVAELIFWKKKFYETRKDYLAKKLGIYQDRDYEYDLEYYLDFDLEYVDVELDFWKRKFYQIRDEHNK